MDWSKGFSATYYMTIVDPVTWGDVDRVEIISGKIARKTDGLMESADVECSDFDTDRERWIRIYLDAAQPGDVAHIPLFTGLSSVPETSINGTQIRYPLTCYSVLKPAEDILLQRGWFAAESFNGAEVVRDLLSVIPAPISVEANAPKLSQSIIAEDGDNHLTMAQKVLEAINWRLKINGDGSIIICPMATNVSAVFGLDNDVIEPSVTRKADWFGCPNVFRAINNDNVAIARDDDERSMLSTVMRGREIWQEESNCDLNDGEGLEQYAQRRLQELQSVAYSINYTRRYNPAISIGDLVELHYPEQGLMGVYKTVSQSIDLGYGAKTSEEVQK